jgi:hypothetical protein
MTRPAPPRRPRALSTLTAALALAAAFFATTQAHAGPTVSADLDLGTSTRPTAAFAESTGDTPSSPYTIGFTLRAGWRFDIGPVWLLPEIGGSYAVERFQAETAVTGQPTAHLSRFLAGGRIGWSGVGVPAIRFEPAIYGHAGAGWYSAQEDGPAFDVGLSLDLRILRRLIVGVQAGYNVVTILHPAAGTSPSPSPGCVQTASGCVPLAPSSIAIPAVSDGWVSYGLHAGVLF